MLSKIDLDLLPKIDSNLQCLEWLKSSSFDLKPEDENFHCKRKFNYHPTFDGCGYHFVDVEMAPEFKYVFSNDSQDGQGFVHVRNTAI